MDLGEACFDRFNGVADLFFVADSVDGCFAEVGEEDEFVDGLINLVVDGIRFLF